MLVSLFLRVATMVVPIVFVGEPTPYLYLNFDEVFAAIAAVIGLSPNGHGSSFRFLTGFVLIIILVGFLRSSWYFY